MRTIVFALGLATGIVATAIGMGLIAEELTEDLQWLFIGLIALLVALHETYRDTKHG